MAELGIVLAIMPLVVTCFEDYGKLATLFKAFKTYTKSVKTRISILNIQQTIFLKANERLLGQCVRDIDQARRMLADRNHDGWRDAEICSLYVERLGDSIEAFQDSIALISDDLAAIRASLGLLHVADGENKGDDPTSMKKKIKYTFKESNIDGALGSLKEKTRDLVSLIDLTTPPATRAMPQKSNLSLRKQMSRFADVHETATDLYQALGHACTKHTGHQAHLSLQPSYSDASQIKFTIAFSKLSVNPVAEDTTPCAKSTWLTVESKLYGRLQSTTEKGAIMATQPLKRTLDLEHLDTQACPRTPKRLVKKRVQIITPCVEVKATLPTLPTTARPAPALVPPLTNLCTHSNFCNQLQKFIADAQPCTAAIGYLELSGSPKHLVYIDSKTTQTITGGTGVLPAVRSLHKMLEAAHKDSSMILSIPLSQKIRVARQLATAVLQFHATPWLRRSWNNREVVVSMYSPTPYSPDDESATAETYVSAQIRGPHGPLARAPTIPNPIVVRNALLFRLGVMLLELAYASPLSAMTIDRDRHGSDIANTEYFTANRLCRQVSAQMGPKYAEITRKCIHCDFGCDFDLKLSKLQEGFYRDVICELEKMEDRLKEW